jgi:hypothetical protein
MGAPIPSMRHPVWLDLHCRIGPLRAACAHSDADFQAVYNNVILALASLLKSKDARQLATDGTPLTALTLQRT